MSAEPLTPEEEARFRAFTRAEYTLRLFATLDRERAEVERLKTAFAASDDEIQQILARALGWYPWYKDDQKNFPGATEVDGVCVGDHVGASLAEETAREIAALRGLLADCRRYINVWGIGPDEETCQLEDRLRRIRRINPKLD